MDPLLTTLKSRGLGLSVNGLFLGAFAHADNIRTSATNFEDVAEQAAIVDSFTKSRGLCLYPEKCALLTSSRKPASASGITIGDTCLPIEHSVKCLGIWWDSSPSSKTSVSERIKKARAAFFSHGCFPWPTKSSLVTQHCGKLHLPCTHVWLRIMGVEYYSPINSGVLSS